MNNKSNKFSPEVRERVVRMAQEHQGEYPSLWAAVESIAHCLQQGWLRRHDGERAGGHPPWGCKHLAGLLPSVNSL